MTDDIRQSIGAIGEFSWWYAGMDAGRTLVYKEARQASPLGIEKTINVRQRTDYNRH